MFNSDFVGNHLIDSLINYVLTYYNQIRNIDMLGYEQKFTCSMNNSFA